MALRKSDMKRMTLRACGVLIDRLLVRNHGSRLAVATVALLGWTLLGPAVPRAWPLEWSSARMELS
jgi:hypothetical protein